MWNVYDRLFLATDDHAADIVALETNHVTHIVNCGKELPNHFPSRFTYLRLDLNDPDARMTNCFASTFAFIDNALKENGNVLIHCQSAISRSPSIVLGYMCHCGASVSASVQHLASVVPTRPNEIFLKQLADYFETSVNIATLEQWLRILGRESGDEYEQPPGT